jgi:hypothetical protein
MNGNHDLDRLLSAPLPPVADAGFSATVMARILAARSRRVLLEVLGIVALSGILLGVLPLSTLTGPIEKFTLDLANSWQIAVAALAIAISLSLVPSETD